jgi:hypothetical protein
MNQKTFILLLSVTGILLALHFNSMMPATIATHFDARGLPNGWMPKEGLLWMNFALFSTLGALFAFFPVRLMNLPNKSYWLAPERAAETETFVRASNMRMGAATLILLIAVMTLVYRANLMTQPVLQPSFLVWMVIYVGYSISEAVRVFKKFLSKN